MLPCTQGHYSSFKNNMHLGITHTLSKESIFLSNFIQTTLVLCTPGNQPGEFKLGHSRQIQQHCEAEELGSNKLLDATQEARVKKKREREKELNFAGKPLIVSTKPVSSSILMMHFISFQLVRKLGNGLRHSPWLQHFNPYSGYLAMNEASASWERAEQGHNYTQKRWDMQFYPAQTTFKYYSAFWKQNKPNSYSNVAGTFSVICVKSDTNILHVPWICFSLK